MKYEAIHYGIKIEISDDLLVHLQYSPDAEIGIRQAQSINQILTKEVGATDFVMISDFANSYANMTREAQRFFASEAGLNNQIIAHGIIVDNLPTRILVKFYLSFFKPKYPTKIFPTAEAAKKWLIEARSAHNEKSKNLV